MAVELKKIKDGVNKLRPGFTKKRSPKVKPSSKKKIRKLKSGEIKGIDIASLPGNDTVTFLTNMDSEFPAERVKQAAAEKERNKTKIASLKKRLRTASSRERADIKKIIKNRRENIRVFNKNPPDKTYRVRIQFQKVKFSDEKSKEFPIPVKVGSGLKFHQALNTAIHPVALKCQCMNFRHNFETQLSKEKSVFGGTRKYGRLTKPFKRPASPSNPNPLGRDFVNPDNELGYCKHIRNLFNVLKKAKIMTEKNPE